MMKKYLLIALTYILYSISCFGTPTPEIHSEGAILIEAQTGTILYSKNMNYKFYPASTTKILSTILLIEELDPNLTITKTRDSLINVPSDSSQIGLAVGDSYSAADGFRAILMASDNYVSHDMAVKASGSISAFSEKMNQKAKELGALHSHFITPHGYHDPNHYTTPYDLSLIAKYAFSNPLFTSISGTPKYDFKVINRAITIPLEHTSELLKKESPYYNAYVIGSKTGFHTPAKRTLVAKASYPNIDLIGVVMKTDAPNQFKDMNTLLEYGSKNFEALTDEDLTNSDHPLVINKTYSPWAKDYITYALDKGWISDTTRNYSDPIPMKELFFLLNRALPSKYTDDIFSKYIHSSSSPIYKENLPIKRKEAAIILQDIVKALKLDPVRLSENPYIPDSISEKVEYYKAIQFVTSTKILGEPSRNFYPNKEMTYEDALCITHRLDTLFHSSAPYLFITSD